MGGWKIGVIGGSGLSALEGLAGVRRRAVPTPWGEPSDLVTEGTIAGVPFAFLPRHGPGHRLPPEAVPYRANIDALKRIGCTDVLAISAVGSLAEDLPPGRLVVVDQFIDRTRDRASSFFGPGLVAHVPMADPVCPRLSALAAAAAREAGAAVTEGATYLAMAGPQFSTRAESRAYRQWGAQLIGMTAMPEAKLAREAELPYALVAAVTDYDCWREGEDVDVATVMARLAENAAASRALVAALARALPPTRTPSPIDRCLDTAIVTAPAARDPALVARLDAVAGRVLRTAPEPAR